MRHFLRKLLLGKITKDDKSLLKINPIQKRILNIQSIWNNDHHEDNGIEKIFRLFLSISQLVFPGVYIKYIFSRKNYEYQNIAMDFYIILKLVFPIYILKNNLQDQNILIYIMVYVLLETVLYIPTLIFASDMLSRPRSYKRSMLLLFLNYLEIVFAFAVLYTLGDNMNKPFTHWFDAIYFSIITANSVGYGDFYPITSFAKVLVCIQAMFFLSFVVLFLNFFSAKVKNKGYFDNED
jgi:voltage-gated potassium channel